MSYCSWHGYWLVRAISKVEAGYRMVLGRLVMAVKTDYVLCRRPQDSAVYWNMGPTLLVSC